MRWRISKVEALTLTVLTLSNGFDQRSRGVSMTNVSVLKQIYIGYSVFTFRASTSRFLFVSVWCWNFENKIIAHFGL